MSPRPNHRPGTVYFCYARPAGFSGQKEATEMIMRGLTARGWICRALPQPVLDRDAGGGLTLLRFAGGLLLAWARALRLLFAGDASLAVNLGLTPATEGQVIRLRVPELNEERRRELVKVAHKYAEAARVAIRHVRRDAMDVLKKLEKDLHTMSEDEHKRQSELVQKATDQAISDVDSALAGKEKEIMTV